MKSISPSWSASNELTDLIAVLHATEQRIAELTTGEVDAVADAQGHTYLLRSAQDSIRLRESARQAAILDALPAQIGMLDRQGTLVSANAAWHSSVIAGKGQRPALQLNCVERKDAAKGAASGTAARLIAGIRTVLAGTVQSFSTEYQEDTDSGAAWYLFTVTPLAGDPVSGAVVMHMDITARKEVSQQLAQSQQRLEHSLRELKSRNVELNDFAFIASHDLQEPLRKVRMLADRLEHNNAAQLDAKGRDYLARMAAAAQRMQTLVSDLLSYSMALRSTSTFAEVDLNLVLAAVLADFDEHLRESKGEIEIGPLPETIWGDASQLRQLFHNLLGNALKYRVKDRAPRVQVQSGTAELADGGPAWRITVTDNGIGFDDAQSDRIFTPFQRLHGRDEYTGTGMGLTIVRRIAERHGGSVQASSTQEQGATFEVLLPQRGSLRG